MESVEAETSLDSGDQETEFEALTEFREEELAIYVEEVGDPFVDLELGRGGCISTLVVLKNEMTYLAMPFRGDFSIIKNGEEIYSGHAEITSCVYAAHLDCFLYTDHEFDQYHANKIYRKDIDDEDPYLFLALDSRHVHLVPYSPIHNRIIFTGFDKNVSKYEQNSH